MKQVYKIAVGTIGVDPKYFLDEMTMEAFQLASEGHYEKSKDDWERTRIIAYNSITPHLKKSIPISEFMPFDWDVRKLRVSTKKDFDILTEIARSRYGL